MIGLALDSTEKQEEHVNKNSDQSILMCNQTPRTGHSIANSTWVPAYLHRGYNVAYSKLNIMAVLLIKQSSREHRFSVR